MTKKMRALALWMALLVLALAPVTAGWPILRMSTRRTGRCRQSLLYHPGAEDQGLHGGGLHQCAVRADPARRAPVWPWKTMPSPAASARALKSAAARSAGAGAGQHPGHRSMRSAPGRCSPATCTAQQIGDPQLLQVRHDGPAIPQPPWGTTTPAGRCRPCRAACTRDLKSAAAERCGIEEHRSTAALGHNFSPGTCSGAQLHPDGPGTQGLLTLRRG